MTQEWIDFFKENYFVAVYGITLIVSVFTYRKYFDTELKYFPILIAYTFFNELLGYFIRYTDGFSFFSEEKYLKANDLIYNLYYIIFFGFFFLVYWKLTKSKRHKKWILSISLLALLTYIVNAFFQNPILYSLYVAHSFSSWLLLSSILIYFFEYNPEIDWRLKSHNLMFWVSLGLGMFFLIFPIMYLIGFHNYELWQKLHLRTVLRILIVLMYSLFIIGFLWSRRRAFR